MHGRFTPHQRNASHVKTVRKGGSSPKGLAPRRRMSTRGAGFTGELMPSTLGDSDETQQSPYNRPLAFVDLETTGLDPEIHEIIEIAFILARQPDLVVLEVWDRRVRPQHIQTADPTALRVNGYRPEAWQDSIPLSEALVIFRESVRDAIVITYRSCFDVPFLVQGLKDAGLVQDGDDPFGYYVLDVLSMAWQGLYGFIPQFRQKVVAEYLSIAPEPEPHTALNGAQSAFQIYRKLMMEKATH